MISLKMVKNQMKKERKVKQIERDEVLKIGDIELYSRTQSLKELSELADKILRKQNSQRYLSKFQQKKALGIN